MKAVIIKEQGKAALAEVKEQSMRPGYIKVKTVVVASNPSMFEYIGTSSLGYADEIKLIIIIRRVWVCLVAYWVSDEFPSDTYDNYNALHFVKHR
jgi:hypothetical protein